jgi:diguanylate cyclase (GGDEF)-like protein
MFPSYAQLAQGLVKDVSGLCLLDARLKVRGQSSRLNAGPIVAWLRGLTWHGTADRHPTSTAHNGCEWVSAVPIEQTDGALLGVFCVCQTLVQRPTQPQRHAEQIAGQLKPLLDCIHRELAAAVPVSEKVQALTERTAELEWLFNVTGKIKGAFDERRLVEDLLVASTERLQCAFGVLSIPNKRLCIEHGRDLIEAAPLKNAWKQTQAHLLAWAQRHNRPMVVNKAGAAGSKITPSKIMSVPVVRDNGRVLGILAFFNPPEAADFASRHVFLARHLGRQTASLVDAQFDLMTGLYTRGGIEQMCGGPSEAADTPERSIIYIDVDHMHVVNELHGFELGNELIIRIAELLGPPILPAEAHAARISGDRFAVVMPDSATRNAAKIAEELQAAAARLVIGPASGTVEVSISCGVAALVSMPQGFARAMAAAELACKSAKKHGRNRVEVYACEDDSMMRRHVDVVAVGELRAALKSDRLLLYAQRITPLRNPSLPGGYELLLRLKRENGEIVAPGPLIAAAQRYQLLPTVDRWVIGRALQTLGAYRSMIKSRGVSFSINISGQSIGDQTFAQTVKEQLIAANLPAGCVILELTEQAAVTNFAGANELIRQLKSLGCRFALDDFGTGANSLTVLKNLQISRVKIDGSFVRDILTDRNSLATCKAVIELAAGLSMDTVAEYVENEAIAGEVRRLGVDYAQGYAFHRPEPLDALLKGLTEDESRRMHRLWLES